MKCRKAARLISLFIDKEIQADDKKILDEHLLNCASCSSLLHEWESAWEQLDMPSAKPDPYFYTRLRAEMNSRSIERKPIALPKWVKAGFAAALLIGGILGHLTAAFNSEDISGISAVNGEWDPYSLYASQSLGEIYLDLAINDNGE